ncbi:MAG: exonuclease RecJ [Deltaproteobacteria bacterium]|nr:exonuclease RecJ [Deltaproteobacteria bacterium]
MTSSLRYQSKKRWRVREPELVLQKTLAASLNISTITSQLLINRGISDFEQAGRFLSSTLSDIRSPLGMKGMKEGVERVLKALHNKEKIAIYGDYDVDGITSTSILLMFLKSAGADVSYYIPERIAEGYGLNADAISGLAERGVTLLITVDCGISDHPEVKLAKELGMDVIVTDHHEVPDDLPPAYAIINPKQSGCPFPFKNLAGVGVAFNFIIALRATLRDEGFWKEKEVPNLKEYLDLVALGTIADVVPLVDENRIFVKYGLMELTASTKPGIIALKEISGLNDVPINAGMVGYRLAPRINAAGRVGKGVDGVRLLTSESYDEAASIAKLLDDGNKERQGLEEVILREATEMVESGRIEDRKSIVLASENWHPGVIGIVASRIAEKYYRPTVMIALKNWIGKGSARSIHSFMLYEGLKECSHLLNEFGGHDYAAGLSINEENIEKFRDAFERVASNKLSDEDMVPEMDIDATMDLNDVTEDLVKELDNLAPFGEANPEPLLCSTGLGIADCRVVGNNHLKMKVKQGGTVRDAIGFGMGNLNLSPGINLDTAFIPQINIWNGGKSIQLKLKDVRIWE